MEEMDWSTSTTHMSEKLKAEALACDLDRWVSYKQANQPYERFEEWLNENLPSMHHRSKGVGWISVRGRKQHSNLGNLDQLLGLWDAIQNSNRPINVDTISDLARMCKVTYGKWLFYVDSGGKGDHLWSIVAKAIIKGLIPSDSAKVSPIDDLDEDEGNKHVICVYNPNYLDKDEVFGCEEGLRKIGIKCPLMYKPDVYTYLGVYRDNPWDLRPSIYRSVYDILLGQSIIDTSNAPEQN